MKIIIEKLSNPKVIFATFVTFIIICILSNSLFHQKFAYLTQTFNYTPEQAYILLASIGKSGRTAHLLIFLADIAMVLLYSCFLVGANYNTFYYWVKNCAAITIITFSPVILAFIQLGEIVVLTIMIANYQERLQGVAQLANSLTIIKYILTIFCFVLPIIGLCGKIIKILVQKRMKSIE